MGVVSSKTPKNRAVKAFTARLYIPWQGQKDLNPQPMVLETTTLPIELYPYGASGGDRTHACWSHNPVC